MADGSTVDGSAVVRGQGREVVLYVHLSEEALWSGDPDVPVWVENRGGRLVTAGDVATWCARADTTKVTVRPVIDLNQPITCTGYQPSDRLAEQVRLRDRTCVYPYCHRPAAVCDLDHVEPWDRGGATTSDNVACICRLHHRMKTHGGWTYQMVAPGVFVWRSPHGHAWRRDRPGTTDLTPPTVQPPEPPDPPGR